MQSPVRTKRRGPKNRHHRKTIKATPTPDQTRSATRASGGPGAQLRRAALQNAGQAHGNQFVLRLLKGAAGIQRQQNTTAPAKGAALVGLKRGDGLVYGTFELRPRVILLQQKLNQKMNAGLQEDGKFGAKTEQILREFQESMKLPGSDTVDATTADLLMSESTPDKPAKEVPQDDKQQLQSTGDALDEAAEKLNKVGARHISAAMKMAQGQGKENVIAGSLFQAGEEIGNSSFRLADAAKALKTGELKSIKTAGPMVKQAGAHLVLAGQHHGKAAETMATTNNRSFKVAAMTFEPLSQAVIAAGQNVKEAGIQLTLYKPPAIPGKQIGDPLVGLKEGDGLVFGTWERRPRVEELQMLLIIQGFGPLKMDGKFGEDTTSALILFQLTRKIEPKNRVDLATAKALRKMGPIVPEGEEPLPKAGNHFKTAGKLLVGAENLLLAGALAIRSGPGPADDQASERLKPAAPELRAAGEALDKAGVSLAGPEKGDKQEKK